MFLFIQENCSYLRIVFFSEIRKAFSQINKKGNNIFLKLFSSEPHKKICKSINVFLNLIRIFFLYSFWMFHVSKNIFLKTTKTFRNTFSWNKKHFLI